MTVYIGYTILKKQKPVPDQIAYVANLPGDNGADWKYTFSREKAIPLSVYWRRRFEKDRQRCGRVGSFSPISI